MFAPEGVRYQLRERSTDVQILIDWKPTEEQSGKHLMCFGAMEQTYKSAGVYIKPRCWNVNVGSSFALNMDFVFPKPNGVAPPIFDGFEIKVHGAFSQPKSKHYLNVYDYEQNFVYQIDLSDPNVYTITPDNRIVIRTDKKRKLTVGKRYFVTATNGLFQSESDCMQARNVRNKEWSFTVRDDPGSYKHFLKCSHDTMQFFLNPEYYTEKEIDRITLDRESCRLVYNRTTELYQTTTPYNECGTVLSENNHYVIYSNFAKVFFKSNEPDDGSMITRADFNNVALECRMLKTATKTLKGKREDGGLVIGTQSVDVHDRAKGVGNFKIDFQVFKSSLYNYSYGTEEFPIVTTLSNRMYFELSLNKRGLKLVPQNCYATMQRSYQSQPRYFLIQDRCPKDKTYQRHRQVDNVFQFSVQVFNFKQGTDSIYVHCETYVCKNKDHEKCQFGCHNNNNNNNNNGRKRRNVEVREEIEGFMTSTLEIKIQGEHVTSTTTIESESSVASSNNKGSKSSLTYLYYLQIPAAVLIIAIAWLIWSVIKRNRRNNKLDGQGRNVIENEATLLGSKM